MITILRKHGIWLSIIFLFAADQFSKWFVAGHVRLGEIPFSFRGFGITYKTNKGFALHVFEQYPLTIKISMALKILLIPVVLFAYHFYLRRYRASVWIRTSFVLLISGMLGNLCDQIFLGYVRDFILWPGPGTPNLADVFIDAGALCLFLEFIRNPGMRMKSRLRSKRVGDE